ncbi:MAG: AMP-binding protein [Verrucomicrobiae bacterium]|nr:AMP-binding protein [Verrucomicrobiae bacterium]
MLDRSSIRQTNIHWLMGQAGVDTVEALYAWTIADKARFWQVMSDRLNLSFKTSPKTTLDATNLEMPQWFPGASLNIVDSCFQSPHEARAILSSDEAGHEQTVSWAELAGRVRQFSMGLVRAGHQPGDRIGIFMSLNIEAVIAYLGIIHSGCVAVTVADSFAASEISARLHLAGVTRVVTQSHVLRAGKYLELFERLKVAGGPAAVVVITKAGAESELRSEDTVWEDFLNAGEASESCPRAPHDANTILFSSGTTGAPKAIIWDHTTPVKSAVDGHLHHDIRPGDVVCWPTNLGWMMGPWLLYAAFMNRASVALYDGAPHTAGFGQFVQKSGVTMLGVVPSLVAAWRAAGCMQACDWSRIRAFSSTGECSNAGDMAWLSALGGGAPVIEYCGGTEVGGGYISGTVVQQFEPGAFTTPAFGTEMVLLDEEGRETDNGEVFLVPPAIGLSRELINADHHAVYYEGTPFRKAGEILRRHGDRIERRQDGYYVAHGRVDDCMNLGGIKVSSAQLESVVSGTEGLRESAAVAVPPPGGGPGLLIFFVVGQPGFSRTPDQWRQEMQHRIREGLNPLFKIHEVVVVDKLPRTASNKVTRRILRKNYEENVK